MPTLLDRRLFPITDVCSQLCGSETRAAVFGGSDKLLKAPTIGTGANTKLQLPSSGLVVAVLCKWNRERFVRRSALSDSCCSTLPSAMVWELGDGGTGGLSHLRRRNHRLIKETRAGPLGGKSVRGKVGRQGRERCSGTLATPTPMRRRAWERQRINTRPWAFPGLVRSPASMEVVRRVGNDKVDMVWLTRALSSQFLSAGVSVGRLSASQVTTCRGGGPRRANNGQLTG